MWFFHLILLLVIYTFGPGMLLVRPLRLARAERLVVAVGVGLFLDYLLSFAIFALHLPHSTHVATTVIGLVLGVVAWRDWQSALRCHQVRRMLWCWLCLLVWGFLLLSMVRHYGGGTWGGDWQEHYERTRFFQGGVPYDFKFINQYPLPMRPPMMNAVVAGILVQAIDYGQTVAYSDFDAVQLAFVFLNSLVVLPCVLVIGRLVKLPPRLARKAPWTLTAVLAASPVFSQNLTYTWTKLFAAFYAILAIAIYLRAWRRTDKDEGRRMKDEGKAALARSSSSFILHSSSLHFVLAFALLCAGFLVHFSAGPYALFLGLHYLFAVWRRRPAKWVEAAAIGGVSSALLAVAWFAWSIAVYGSGPTFTSTSAVSESTNLTPGQNVVNIAKNLGNTLLPAIVRKPTLIRDFTGEPPAPDSGTRPATNASATAPPPAIDDDEAVRTDLEQPSAAGRVRDFFFLVYQVSLPGGLGIVGCGIAVWLLLRVWTGRHGSLPQYPLRRFWIAMIPTVFVVGVAVYGGVDRFGVAHICLQPLILLGLCLIAGGIWTLGPRVRGLLLVGLLLDFVLGVFIHMELQHDISWFDIAEFGTVDPNGVSRVVGSKIRWSPNVPSRGAQSNLRMKNQGGFAFWGDRFPDALPLQLAVGGLLAFMLFKGLLAPRGRRAVELARARAAAAEKPRRTGKSSRGGKPRR